jgi:hypothetical protein
MPRSIDAPLPSIVIVLLIDGKASPLSQTSVEMYFAPGWRWIVSAPLPAVHSPGVAKGAVSFSAAKTASTMLQRPSSLADSIVVFTQIPGGVTARRTWSSSPATSLPGVESGSSWSSENTSGANRA